MSIKKGIYAASMTVINKDLSVNADATIQHSEKLNATFSSLTSVPGCLHLQTRICVTYDEVYGYLQV